MREIWDIHTHILPCLDDGSGGSQESIEMLKKLHLQGVTDVVATPHFYARNDEPDRFIYNRDKTAEHLVNRINSAISSGELKHNSLPNIYIGAEVAFFNAMSNVDKLCAMCISGTRYLLVEMPFEKWTSAMVNELYLLMEKQDIIPIIAHVDRYFSCFSGAMLDTMLEKGILVQCNTDAFLSLFNRMSAIKLLKKKNIHFLGSDCHNMSRRPPNFDLSIDQIKKRVDINIINTMFESGAELMKNTIPIFSNDGGIE